MLSTATAAGIFSLIFYINFPGEVTELILLIEFIFDVRGLCNTICIMKDLYVLKLIKFIIAIFLCSIALLLPYRLRMGYINILAFLIHLPFVTFGKIIKYFFKKLKINPNDIEWR